MLLGMEKNKREGGRKKRDKFVEGERYKK